MRGMGSPRIERMLVLTLAVFLVVGPAGGLASEPALVEPGVEASHRSDPDLLGVRGGKRASKAAGERAWAADSPAASGQRTLLSTGDAGIDTFLSDTNYGSQDQMASGYFDDSSGEIQVLYRSLVQFDLGGLSPGQSVDRATLRVYALPLQDPEHQLCQFQVRALTGPWEEDTVTWNNQPASGPAYSAAEIWDTDEGWLEFDVTEFVASWHSGAQPNYGLMLLGPEDWAGDAWPRSFRTREGAHPPELVVEGLFRTHLPLAMAVWRLKLEAPGLFPVQRGEREGCYTLHWTASAGASWYVLEEDDHPDFSSPRTCYTGPALSWEATDQPPGIFFYRVRAGNAWQLSDWSNAVSNFPLGTAAQPPDPLLDSQ